MDYRTWKDEELLILKRKFYDANIDGIEGFTNDPVYPEQFYQSQRSRTPEVDLMSSIFCDAINTLIGKIVATREEWEADWQWIQSNDEEWLYSYLKCCQVLDLNHIVIRDMVLKNKRPPDIQPDIRKMFGTPEEGENAYRIPTTHLSDELKAAIRSSTLPAKETAAKYGVSTNTVYRCQGRTWSAVH